MEENIAYKKETCIWYNMFSKSSMKWLHHLTYCKLNSLGGTWNILMVVETLFHKVAILEMQDAS